LLVLRAPACSSLRGSTFETSGLVRAIWSNGDRTLGMNRDTSLGDLIDGVATTAWRGCAADVAARYGEGAPAAELFPV
jgi:hypothetical protein